MALMRPKRNSKSWSSLGSVADPVRCSQKQWLGVLRMVRAAQFDRGDLLVRVVPSSRGDFFRHAQGDQEPRRTELIGSGAPHTDTTHDVSQILLREIRVA